MLELGVEADTLVDQRSWCTLGGAEIGDDSQGPVGRCALHLE